jgi:Flp pilus assembly protein TadG
MLARDDRGQTVVLVALSMTVLLGMGALAIDVGHARYTYRELQATTDSAALAAAHAMPTATASTQITGLSATQTSFSSVSSNGVAAEYGAVTGGANHRTTLPSVSMTTTLKCLTTLQAAGIPCVGNVPYNAVQVTQTSVLPMYFAGVLGHHTMTLSTTSTAAIRGGSPRPTNVAVVMDTTLSMVEADDDCGETEMQCALNGFQVLLQHLSPCGANVATCTISNGVASNSFDRVALFTFPNVTVGTASQFTSCTTPIPASGYLYEAPYGYISMLPETPYSDLPTDVAYSFPSAGASSYSPSGSNTATYQVTQYLSDYRTSDTATTLNSNSTLVKAAGGVSGCGGMAPANFDGEYGTYYAGVIYAAQASLVNEQAANPGSENVMIILSDGNATALQTNNGYAVMPSPATNSGNYPSWVGECGQAIVAANAATSAGTLVYTVAYGSEPTGCTSDAGAGSYSNVSPCDTMSDMASAPQMFYSDWKQSGSGSTCYASQPITALSQIFAAIAADLTQARLIPNNTT